MSWTLSTPTVPRAEFAAAVDAAVPTGQTDPEGNLLPGVAEDAAVAREQLKRLAERTGAAYLTGYASGHALQEGEDPTSWHNGLSLSVASRAEAPAGTERGVDRPRGVEQQ